MISKTIFREYDIRGIYGKDLFDEDAYKIGLSIGYKLNEYNVPSIVVGYDNRYSSVSLEDNLVKGLVDSGVNVIRIGLATTPMVYFARINLNLKASVVVTASHNPKEYNGFKICFNGVNNACGNEIQELYDLIINNMALSKDKKGVIENKNIKESYINYILSDININNDKLKVVYDLGNGTTSVVANDIFDRLNANTIGIFNDSNPDFPNHHPDPNVKENLELLSKKVLEEKADIGVSYDGDGDRVGVIDEKGNYVTAEEFMILIWRSLYNKVEVKKGLYDVKCSKILSDELEKLGIEGILNKTGNCYLQMMSHKEHTPFSGEESGHTIFNDRFGGFEDAIYTSLRIIEIVSTSGKTISELLKGINYYYNTPMMNYRVTDESKFDIIEKIKEYCISNDYNINTIDGVKIINDDSSVLFRASNTSPNITYRYEATTEDKLKKLRNEFDILLDKFSK